MKLKNGSNDIIINYYIKHLKIITIIEIFKEKFFFLKTKYYITNYITQCM